MTAAIHSMPDLIAALRARRDELNISHETIDSIAGWQAGYTSKLLAPNPIRRLGRMSLETILGALGLALVAVPDPVAIAKVQQHWDKRKRPQRLPLSIPLSIDNQVPATLPISPELQAQIEKREKMKSIGSKGGKRRAKTMRKRARQAAASHAARMRWAKRATAAAMHA